ncbi:TlpA family protein disulfide reductase [Fibrivirga algicola]|uniref:TlpA family protein disulfide reductase n=1 Tax=Fibrivirga algicola TaxID=2950420 RepID=A0ABX0QIT9_9BACT|nr:TlpA disulfide reductase family protein [Fibrivirga algicola]ARK10533.1 hypothetical protein A6C57_09460 [Fibrella sp. ES10-3-2-2]NID12046.1 TlpA family protein disulfide reductase [Fibrivirga algicola]
MKKYLLISTSSLVLLLLLIPLGGFGGHHIKFSIASFAYCFLTYYLLRNTDTTRSKLNVTSLLLLPLLLIYVPLHILDFTNTMYALPSSVAHFIGIFAGLLLNGINRQWKVVFLPLFSLLVMWGSLSGYDWWANKVYYGSYSGLVNEEVAPFTLIGADGQSISSTSLKGQFVVLDFWNTSCVTCFKKFPKLQRFHTQYEHNSKVKFFAVNIPLSRDLPGQAVRAIRKDGYTFPVLLAESKSLIDLFKVNSFPTVIILDPSQRIIYRGMIDNIDGPLSRELALNR